MICEPETIRGSTLIICLMLYLYKNSSQQPFIIYLQNFIQMVKISNCLRLHLISILKQPVNSSLQILLHILLLLIAKLEHDSTILKILFDIILDLIKNLTLNILSDFFRLVSSFLQPLVQSLVLTSHQYYQIEVVNRKDIRTVEVKEQTSCCNVVVGGQLNSGTSNYLFQMSQSLLSIIILPIGMYLKLRDWLISWQNVVLPVPGVPVTRMLGVFLCVWFSSIIVEIILQ